MKKLLSLVLVVAMVCSLFSAVSVSAEETKTWGVDNLNNKEGDLVIGFIGGSVTEGSGASPMTTYRWSSLLVKNYFKKNYPEKTVIERNAGIGGTTSYSGHTRILGDLECYGEKSPDVVFIEFGINDVGNNATTSGQNMESMVRQLMSLPKVPAIVFVYLTKTASDHTRHTGIDAIKAAHKKVADNYGIFQIDIDEYMWSLINSGKYKWTSLSADTAHPNNTGYGIYADYMIDQLTKNKAAAFKKLDPETPACSAYVYGPLEEVLLSDPAVKMSEGDWEFVASNPAGANWSKSGDWVNKFAPDGYYVAEDGPNASIEFEFTGRGIGFQVVRTHHNAKFKWEVYNEGGALVKNGTKSIYYSSDTTRIVGEMLATNLTYGKYKIKITGVLNDSALKDNESDPSKARTGKRMPIVCFVVEKAMPVIHPVAKEVKLAGDAVAGGALSGSYKFECNTYKEGTSVKSWYISDTENGQYTKVADGESLDVKTEYLGKYVKYAVTPVNDSEYKTAGKTVYSDAALVTRKPGEISSTPAEIKVDGAASDVLKAGKNTVSVNVTNEGTTDCTVYLTVALNDTKDGITKTNGVKLVSKLIPAGKTETVSAEITIDAGTTFTDGKIILMASDSFEPAKIVAVETAAVEYVGQEDDKTSIYKINRFE